MRIVGWLQGKEEEGKSGEGGMGNSRAASEEQCTARRHQLRQRTFVQRCADSS